MKPQGILLTPGTGTSKRKRVSFGHDVHGRSKTNLDRITEIDEAAEPPRDKVQGADNSASDDEWEEEDGDLDTHDVTLDLNEPHSQSGRYWKEEFLKYHQEAKAEMEKLLKYKQLAKSYAQQRDAEAIQLAERLRDEQQRVIKMKKRITENASQIVVQQQQSSGEDPTEMLDKLSKQTSLASQYRLRVQELESQMEDLIAQREVAAGADTPRRRYLPTPSVAATQKTLSETRRELRRARSQLKDLDSLRDEVFTLKTKLKKAELKLVVNEKEEAHASAGPRAQELRTLLRAAKDESRRKDEEIRLLKDDFETLRKESEAHDADTKAVLERAHTKIADLKKDVKALKAARPEGQSRPHSWHTRTKGAEQVEEAKPDEPLRATDKSAERRSGDDGFALEGHHAQPRSLRQQFMDDAAAPASSSDPANTGKPKWQPFVPRTPRARAYDTAALASHHLANDARNIAAPDLPVMAKAVKREQRNATPGKNGQVDLLSDRFARLGGPGPNNHINSSMVANTSKSTLPPERRAAALARIEKRMAEKKKLRNRSAMHDKENVQP